jgi:hypothetical protein
MDVASMGPLRVSRIVWQPRAGVYTLTVICKATYLLRPGEAQLLPSQEAPEAPGDRAPYKPRADVVLVGHAFAPGRQPVRSLVARMVVGEIEKSIEVWCDRGFRLQDGQLLEGPRFAQMPLGWERAAGGPETPNPVGMRPDAAPDRYGMVAIPNLQPRGVHVAQRSDTFAPVGFGPIAGSWPPRAARLRGGAAPFDERGWEERPLPDDFDYGYFNVAPPDQQTSEIRPNERIVLDNLHPEHAQLVTSLPGARPRAFIERQGRAQEEVGLRADTLWIDTDSGRCTVTWRGQVSLAHEGEQGRVSVTLEGNAAASGEGEERSSQTPAPPIARPDAQKQAESMTMAPSLVPKARAIPFAGASEGAKPPEKRAPERADEALPFGQGPGGPARAPAPAPSGDGTIMAPMMRKGAPPAPPPAPPPVMSAPPIVARPPEPPKERKLTVGELMSSGSGAFGTPEPKSAPAAAKRAEDAAALRPPAASGPVKHAVQLGAAAASDAAAGAREPAPGEDGPRAAPAPAPRASARARLDRYVDLLWFDKSAPKRIRAQAGWAETLRDSSDGGAWLTTDEAHEPLQQVRARRDVVRALMRVEPVDDNGVLRALADAVDEEGALVPPLVVVSGEITLSFKEIDTLKATTAAVSQVMGTDKRLRELVDLATELLQSEWKCTRATAESTTNLLREALGQSARSLPAGYLDLNVERELLEQRCYQKRVVLGEKRIRAAITPEGRGTPIPAYLPEHLEAELPLFQRFRGAVIAEVRAQQDQFESSPLALVVLAIARVLPMPGRR